MHHRGQIDHQGLDYLELSQLAYAIYQVPGTRSYLAENLRISERGCDVDACPRLTHPEATQSIMRRVLARVRVIAWSINHKIGRRLGSLPMALIILLTKWIWCMNLWLVCCRFQRGRWYRSDVLYMAGDTRYAVAV
jgi:hypothetical protein